MERISDAKAVAAWVARSRYAPVLRPLQTELCLLGYEKGELATSPLEGERWFQIVARGSLNIYFIRDDGGRYSLSSGKRDYLLGDMELCQPHAWSIYTEAAEPLLCLALSLDRNREALLNNNAFLRMIGESLTAKMVAITALDAAPRSLPDRVLSYMRFKCEGGELRGLERESFRLHCSARQLQRILNQLASEGRVEKVGKGAYRLTDRDGMA